MCLNIVEKVAIEAIGVVFAASKEGMEAIFYHF
jgi:hypothetical protein